jgi:uncharacterized membrane protein (UPF0127 family)
MTTVLVPVEFLARAGDAPDRLARRATSFADDGELLAFHLAGLAEASMAIRELARAGVAPMREGEPGEVAIVDQLAGPLAWWPWLELARLDVPGGAAVLAARRAGDGVNGLALPAGWRFAGSPSDRDGGCALELVDRPLRHLRREARADVYVDRWTGEEVRVGRANPRTRLDVRMARGPVASLQVEVVSRWPEIELGLMFRERVPDGEGMLFRFQEAREQHFWMKNTLVPLDVLFVDAGGRVVNVVERVEPLRLARIRSAGAVPQVLEVPGGWCAANGIGAGATIEVARPSRPTGCSRTPG